MLSTMHRRDLLRMLVAAPVLGGLVTACQDKDKDLQALLAPGLERLLPLTVRDTKQVREGLPKAAVHISKHLDTDPGADVEGLRRILTKTREEIKELAFSKITFFAFAAPDGIILRTEIEPDLAVGHSLTKAIPSTKEAFKDQAKMLETFGYMEGLRAVNKGNQLQWVLVAPVAKEGKLVGGLVAGWSLRGYASILDSSFKHELEKSKTDPKKPNPLAYVFVVKGKVAYGGPMAPDVNAAMLGDLDLPSKVEGDALFQSVQVVERRKFIVGARRAPALGEDMFLAAMLSAV